MGHAGNRTYRTLALISLSVFRDHILELDTMIPTYEKQLLH